MTNIPILEDTVTANIGKLTLPREPVKRVEYGLASVAVRILDAKTLDLGVYVKANSKEPYDNLQSFWYGVLPEIQTNIPSWQKTKKLLEFKHTLTCNDRTITPEGNETAQRASVIDGLQGLIDFYAALPMDVQAVKRYSGRTDPKQSDFDTRLANERKFLSENKDALMARVFSNADQIKRIYAHHAKFAEGILYRTDLRGVKDE